MPSSVRDLGLSLCAGCVLLSSARSLRAEVPEVLHLEAQGACPSGETIQRQLGPLLPGTRVVLGSSPEARLARVSDTGGGFIISVDAAEREIVEPARDCVERARISAVFIALVLDPPLVASSATPAAPTTPASAPEREASSSVETRTLVSAAASLSTALASSGPNPWSIGPWLGVAFGSARWELAASGSLLTPFTLQFASGSVRMLRAPFEFGGRWLSGPGSIAGYLGAGVEMDVLQLTGIGFERSYRSLRLGVGARAALGLRAVVSPRWAAFSEIGFVYFPRPYQLELEPEGVLGETPKSWLALTVGAIL